MRLARLRALTRPDVFPNHHKKEVEMRLARLRALTHKVIFYSMPSCRLVEMRLARLRALILQNSEQHRFGSAVSLLCAP